MTLDDDQISILKIALMEQGSVWATDKQGDRLFFIHSRVLGNIPQGLLISYEGKGSFFFTLDRPLNKFRLVTAGFPLTITPWLAELVNKLTGLYKPSERPIGQKRIASKRRQKNEDRPHE